MTPQSSAIPSPSGPVLVTGAAGFIGHHVALRYLEAGVEVVGLDNLNASYDVALKEARLARLAGSPRFRFMKADLSDAAALDRLFAAERPPLVIHLAAQAGVRRSIEEPRAYMGANLDGFLNILEGCRNVSVGHLVYASTSSVYGIRADMPLSEHLGADHPVSLYAATKRANELMAHAYSHLFRLPATGLRFFTVYGPWGRPDMALFKFTRAMLEGRPIEVFDGGRLRRDFTYVDDIVEGIVRLAARPPAPDSRFDPRAPDPASSSAPFRIYNIGAAEPVSVNEMIACLEAALGRKAKRIDLPMQPGDVEATHADVSDLMEETGYRPQVPLAEGVRRFVTWYRAFYGV